MQKINQKFVDKLNEEVSSENFEEIIDKYELDTPEESSHSELCEQDGVEVWGVSEEGEVLLYDAFNGFFLLSKHKWIQEIRNQFDEEADIILSEMGMLDKPIYHDFTIYGFEGREFTVRSGSNTSARINVPLEWIGKRVMVVRLE